MSTGLPGDGTGAASSQEERSPAIKSSAGVSLEIQKRLSQVDRYNQWIFEQFRPFIGQRVLDVGCAIGNITQFYLDREHVVGVDVVEEFVTEIRRRFGDRANFRAELFDIADPAVLSLANERIDTVVCINVLEHVENDALALDHIREILVPGGRLLLLVPAFAFLFGTMDEADHHYRRYRKPLLEQRLSRAGFRVEMMRYMNVLGMAGWFLNGKILKRQVISTSHYSLYNRLVPLLSRLERLAHPPVGLSLIAAARKPEEAE